MSQCSAVLNDPVGEANDRTQIFERLSNSVDHVNNLKRAVSELSPPSYLINRKNQLDEHDLVVAGNFLDVLASETSNRVDSSCGVIGFNIPDVMLMNGLRNQLMVASGMATYYE